MHWIPLFTLMNKGKQVAEENFTGQPTHYRGEHSRGIASIKKVNLKNDWATKRVRGYIGNNDKYYYNKPTKTTKVKGISPIGMPNKCYAHTTDYDIIHLPHRVIDLI